MSSAPRPPNSELEPRQLTLIATTANVIRHRRPLPRGYASRPMTEKDPSALADLFFAAYPREVVADREAATDEIDRSMLGEYGSIEFKVSPVIERYGEVVGSVMTVLVPPWSDVPRGPFIIEVMVHPKHRRRGLAEHAIQLAATNLPATSGPTLALRVMSDNDGARKLYAKLGFQEQANVCD